MLGISCAVLIAPNSEILKGEPSAPANIIASFGSKSNLELASSIQGLSVAIAKDLDIQYLRENIEDVENVEKSVLLKEDIVKMLKEGNQIVLKKKLNELIKGKSEDLIRSIKDQIVKTATEVGVDSSAKRKVICEFAGLDYEMVGDVLFEVQ